MLLFYSKHSLYIWAFFLLCALDISSQPVRNSAISRVISKEALKWGKTSLIFEVSFLPRIVLLPASTFAFGTRWREDMISHLLFYKYIVPKVHIHR